MTIPKLTPAKNPFTFSSHALARAIAEEWEGAEKFSASKMPLTSLAYTAIDRIAPQKEAVIEALLVFLDTDTLSYRADEEGQLLKLQQTQWNPVLMWVEKKFGYSLEVTSGVMPIDQPPELHTAIGGYLKNLSAMQLAALSVLASNYSSLLLAVAVVAGHMDAMAAFALSRLEEEVQNERWGRDEEAVKRTRRLEEETRSVSSFLSLLDSTLDELAVRH